MKSQIKMVRGSSSKSGVVYTIAFENLGLLQASIIDFTKNGCEVLNQKTPIKTKNGYEVRIKAREQSLIRTTLRILKKSGPSFYRGQKATYIKKASDEGIKLAKKLASPKKSISKKK